MPAPVLTRRVALSGFALFALIGATAAIYGPTIPAFRATFHITAATAGLLLSGHYAGSLLGTVAPSFLPDRFRAPRLVAAASIICFGLGCLGIAVAPIWPVAVVGAIVEGTGWGGLVIAFNSLFTAGFGRRSAAMLTLLNALYGIGAIIGPVGVGLLAGGHFRGPFLTVAVAALVLLPLTFTLPDKAVSGTTTDGSERGAVSRTPWLLVAFVAAFFLYGGLEGGIGAWEATHLIATGLSAATAATVTALFWTTYTTGRLIVAPISLLVKPERLVLASLAAVLVIVLLARIEAITAAAYTVCGLALAPIFPLALVWSGRVMRISQRITSFVIAGDLLGGVVLSAVLGRLITATAPESIPFAFAALAGGALCLLLAVQLNLRRRPAQEM